MPSEVSYGTVGERRLLRFALWRAWGMKCYWCDVPKRYLDVEIDHIVPKGLDQTELQRALNGYGLPADFDVHDPKNLAPICHSCNGPGRKGSSTYSGAAVVLGHLGNAGRLRSKVVRTVQDFKRGGDVAKALLELASADTAVADVRDHFKTYFPAVASTAASIDSTLVDLPTYRELNIDCGYPVRIDLDSRFTHELWLLENFLNCDLETALKEPLGGLMRDLTIEMEHGLQGHSELEPVHVGPPVPYAFDVRVVEINFPRRALDSEMEVELVLRFDGGLTSAVTRYADNGSELLELQGEAEVSGTAVVYGTWSSDDGLFLSEDVTIEEHKVDTWLE
jgi:hypothetical protein